MFNKTASVTTIGVATSDDGQLKKSAAYEGDTSSVYINGTRSINITTALEKIAEEYDISTNPQDYIFEAIRGNTTNVPNENKDAFHKNELLRFDHRLAKRVYETYQLKPHHINHRAENPKNSRGFIVDAHYNDSAPPLDKCPNDRCGNKTASIDGRDETGIHCNKCGTVVKDEFVELLVAIDTKKDPAFADGIKRGILRNGSMGCSCMRTRCNVCNKVAYTRSEFCKHIAGSKGKEFDESEPGFNPIAYTIVYSKDKTAGSPRKVAKSFEWCEGVIFDEYSRVHDPADPKAEQYEILKLTAKVAQLENEDQLRNESEILIIQSKLAELEKKFDEKIAVMNKAAQKDSDVNISIEEPNGGPENVEIESEAPLEEAKPDAGTPIGQLKPEDMGLTPAGPGQQMSPAAVGIAPPPGGPSATPPPRRGSNDGKTLNRALENLGGLPMLRFAESYKHLKAEITSVGNVRVYDDEGTLFAVKPENIDVNSKVAGKDGEELAKSVLTMIADHGIGGAIKSTNAIVGPRLAQVLEHYMDDMLNKDRMDTNSVLDEEANDSQTARPRDSKTESATADGSESDHKDKHDTVSLQDDVLEGRDSDMEDEQHDRDPNSLSVLENTDSDMRDKRKPWDHNQSSQDDVTLDHQEKAASAKTAEEGDGCKKCSCDPCECEPKMASNIDLKKHAARLEAIYQKRLAAKVEALEKEKEEFKSSLNDRFARAMKIAFQRQALNLEYSPLKTAMGIALCNKRDLGNGEEFVPMDQRTAVTIVEAAFNEPMIEGTDKAVWETMIDNLLNRAAAIMDMSDETLMQVEADLRNVKSASVVVDDTSHKINVLSDADIELRTKAAHGNLQIAPNAVADTGSTGSSNNKRSAIRQAVGTTKVASSRQGFGI